MAKKLSVTYLLCLWDCEQSGNCVVLIKALLDHSSPDKAPVVKALLVWTSANSFMYRILANRVSYPVSASCCICCSLLILLFLISPISPTHPGVRVYCGYYGVGHCPLQGHGWQQPSSCTLANYLSNGQDQTSLWSVRLISDHSMSPTSPLLRLV